MNFQNKNIIIKSAGFSLLTPEAPTSINNTFLELRRWETADKHHVDLIAEYGFVDGDGELITAARILPFHLTWSEALHWLGRQPELFAKHEFGRRGRFGMSELSTGMRS